MGILRNQKCIMIVAGEASGDLHGAKVVTAMRQRDADLFFCGIGGRALNAAGVKILVDASTLAVVGITEALPKAFKLLKGLSVAKRLLKTLRPDLLILIDFPDFNLHLAGVAKKHGIPVLYYVSPQVWAWRPGRIKKIGRRVDHMAVILPFEEKLYRSHHIPVTFVGHPLLDSELCCVDDGDGKRSPEKRADGRPVIGFLPGSRDQEVARHLPVMLDAAGILQKRFSGVTFLISKAPSVERARVEKLIRQHGGSVAAELVPGGARNVLQQSELVVAASGTVTLEAAIFGAPMVIIYKVSAISYWLARILVRVEAIGLINLVAGRKIAPELVQRQASPKNIAESVCTLLTGPAAREALLEGLCGVKNSLGGPGASERVADIAFGMLEK